MLDPLNTTCMLCCVVVGMRNLAVIYAEYPLYPAYRAPGINVMMRFLSLVGGGLQVASVARADLYVIRPILEQRMVPASADKDMFCWQSLHYHQECGGRGSPAKHLSLLLSFKVGLCVLQLHVACLRSISSSSNRPSRGYIPFMCSFFFPPPLVSTEVIINE